MQNLTVTQYITEEVRRQGHNPFNLDGIERIGWMHNAWSFACRAAAHRIPTMDDAIHLGKMIEPVKNYKGIRMMSVHVGLRLCPDYLEVPRLLDQLFSSNLHEDPIAFYKEFEMIHPFVDGNGRTGKVLLNWLNNSLLNPIFPPRDLFGMSIQNP